jgi:hypothetical protein
MRRLIRRRRQTRKRVPLFGLNEIHLSPRRSSAPHPLIILYPAGCSL